jgi:hypothetical protein
MTSWRSPFDVREVYRVVFLAWDARRRRIQASAERNGKPETSSGQV